MRSAVRIAVVGDFNPEFQSHHATNAALCHAAGVLGLNPVIDWIPTAAILENTEVLSASHGVLLSPGSPYRSMEGALHAAEFARRRDWPFLGACGGFQHALLEYARNVLGIRDAAHAEYGSASASQVIRPVACAQPAAGVPTLCGSYRLRIRPGTLLFSLYQRETANEHYFCSYEVNPDYVPALEKAGLRISAYGERDEPRAFELPDHRFFLATLFQPQLAPAGPQPHPVIEGFLQAARQPAHVRKAQILSLR